MLHETIELEVNKKFIDEMIDKMKEDKEDNEEKNKEIYEIFEKILSQNKFILFYKDIENKSEIQKIKYEKIKEDRIEFLKSRWNLFHDKMNCVLKNIFPGTYIVATPWDFLIVKNMLSS